MIDLVSLLTAFMGILCTFILFALAATRIRHAYLRIGRNYTQISPVRRLAPRRGTAQRRRHIRPNSDGPISLVGITLYTYRITNKWIDLHRN